MVRTAAAARPKERVIPAMTTCPRCRLSRVPNDDTLCFDCLAELQMGQLMRAYALAAGHHLPPLTRPCAPFYGDRCPECGSPSAQFAVAPGDVVWSCVRPHLHGRLCS